MLKLKKILSFLLITSLIATSFTAEAANDGETTEIDNLQQQVALINEKLELILNKIPECPSLISKIGSAIWIFLFRLALNASFVYMVYFASTCFISGIFDGITKLFT